MTKLYLWAAALCLAAVLPAKAQYILTQEAFPQSRFAGPTEMQPIPGRPGRVAISTQAGIIRTFDLDSASRPTDTLLNITSLTTSNQEMGLLGFAFHPQYPSVNRVYVDYVDNVSTPGSIFTVIASFAVDTATGSASVASQVIHLRFAQPNFGNHKGGKVEFGPDGMLYIAAGDGGSANDPLGNGQNRTVLLGKIIRIDVDTVTAGLGNYGIPADNPFVDSAAPVRKEIYTYGMRNPWRFSWDAPTNRLWVADVGQGQYEEIDTVISGGNYGWRYREGYNCTPGLPNANCNIPGIIDPIFQYTHADNNLSITGGYVYRGSAMPFLYGKYVYGDYVSGRIWALGFGGDTLMVNQLLLDSPYNIQTFGRDAEGELYICHSSGAIYKLVADPTAVQKSISHRLTTRVYPNPATHEASVELSLSASTQATLRLLTPSGQIVRTVAGKRFAAGRHTVSLPVEGLPAGLYMVQVDTPEGQMMHRFTLLR